MLMWILFAVTSVQLEVQCAQINWCAKEHDCLVNGAVRKHTLCTGDDQIKLKNFASSTNVLTDKSRKYIVKSHNEFRNRTAGGGVGKWPKGSNIRQLTWDYTLEELATRWAKQCEVESDVCRKTPEYPVIGQNIGIVTFREGDPEPSYDILSDWLKSSEELETEKINDTVRSYKHGAWFPATQIMWAQTVKIGCGEVTCTKNQSNLFRVLVCNYAPGGNIVNQTIYNTGKPCAEGCPSEIVLRCCKPG